MSDGSLSILKTVIDSLVNTLTEFSVRQKTMERDLNQIRETVNGLPEVQRAIDEILANQDKTMTAINSAKTECIEKMEALKGSVQPISQLSELIKKPLSIVVFIITILICAAGVFKLGEALMQKSQPQQINQPIPTPSSTNQTGQIP